MTTTAPPPPAPPPLAPNHRIAVRAVLVLAASALVLGAVATLGVAAWRIDSLRMRSENEALPGTMRSLTIDAADATVHVEVDPQAGAPRVEFRAVDSVRDQRSAMAVSSTGSSTRITVFPNPSSPVHWGQSGQVIITLPPELARSLSMTTQQDDGRLTVDAYLDQLTAHTVDGDIELNRGARRIAVTTRDGDVTAHQPIAIVESFEAHTVDGDVDVALSKAAPRNVEVGTRDGDIEISLPGPGPYLVDAPPDSSSIRVAETSDPTRAVARVAARTIDGRVVITPTEGLS